MTHLHPKIVSFVENSSDDDRINSVQQPKWIGYTLANNILHKFQNLVTHPTTHRMPNVLLVGDSNNGKTALLHRFLKRNESEVDEQTGAIIIPVVMIQAPPEPDEKRLYNTILEALFAPYKVSEKVELRQQRTLNLLRKVKTKVLIIDEIHHVLAGTMSKQRLFLNVIKYLSNELKISLICSGTRDAFNAIQTDPQLSNRFEPKVLSKWTKNEDYLRLLASFETLLPLQKPSNLIEGSINQKILYMSDGLIGEIARILELATALAIETNIERINHNILDNIDFVKPSERKKMIHRM